MTLRYALLGTAALAFAGTMAADETEPAADTSKPAIEAESEPATADTRIAVNSEADLPRTEFALSLKPS